MKNKWPVVLKKGSHVLFLKDLKEHGKMYGKTCDQLKNKRPLVMSKMLLKKKKLGKKFKNARHKTLVENKRPCVLPKSFILKTFKNFLKACEIQTRLLSLYIALEEFK